jgi:quinol monooxygenase YgiN
MRAITAYFTVIVQLHGMGTKPESTTLTGQPGHAALAVQLMPAFLQAHWPPGIVKILIRRQNMVKVALLVRLDVKSGKEKEVENLLKGGLPFVGEEPATIAWFAIRLGPTTYGIFDAFPDEAGRQAHLAGKVAAALVAKAGELFTEPPSIEMVDVLAAKLPVE